MMDKLNWQGFSGVKRCLWAAGLSLGLGAGLPGCVAHARGEMVYESPSDYVYSTEYVVTVPPRIEVYPHTYYQGRPAYLVDGRWYYHDRERWVVFREEPASLRHYRLQSVDRGRSVPSSYPRYASGRESQRRVEQRRAEHRRQEQHREQERRAERYRQEQARRAQEHHQAEQRRQEQRAAERADADHRGSQRRRGNRERERDRAEQERRPRQHGRRDQRDDRRDD